MPRMAEIWYFERSVAASLARLLGRRYALHELARPSPGHRIVVPRSGDAHVVCLADLGDDNLITLRRLASRAPRVRLIGISRNGNAGEPAPGCFATLPRKAGVALVRMTVDAAFANIELARREFAARNELKRAELKMEEM